MTLVATADSAADSAIASTPSIDGPTLAGAIVSLRAIGPADYERLRSLELSSSLLWRWRHGGHTPSPEAWTASLWNGALAQFLVVDNRTGEWVGLVNAYDADQRNQHAYIAAAKFAPSDRSARVLQGAMLFVDYVFSTWSFRKLYFEAPAFNLDQFRSAVGWLLVEEGRLRDHICLDGRLWDLLVLALYRAAWNSKRPELVEFAREENG